MLKPRTLIKGFRVLQSHSSCCDAVTCELRALHFAAHDNAAYYCHSHCTDVSATRADFSSTRNLGFSNTSSCLNHIRFLRVPRNLAKENSRRSWVEPPEQTGRGNEFQGSHGNDATEIFSGSNSDSIKVEAPRRRMGLGEKTNILVDRLLKVKNSKEAVYGALDSWVAWELDFPLAVLKRASYQLQQKEKWHLIIQLIKWMLSKGQATTMGTYEQLLRALERDHRAEEAHAFWEKRIGSDLHSVPWQLCTFMIYMYARNNMPERLIKLFNDLEMFNRKPPEKAVIEKVAAAYELLGLQEERERVLEKYQSLFTASPNFRSKKKKGKRNLKNGGDKNAGEDKLKSGGDLPEESELLLESLPLNSNAGSDSNGTESTTIDSSITAT